MLFYLDDAAVVYAYGKCALGTRLVTFRLDETVFRRPVHLGEILTFYGSDPVFTKCSISFRITVKVNDEIRLETGVTMVAVDMHGAKIPLIPA